jgi:hypothetical protein
MLQLIAFSVSFETDFLYDICMCGRVHIHCSSKALPPPSLGLVTTVGFVTSPQRRSCWRTLVLAFWDRDFANQIIVFIVYITVGHAPEYSFLAGKVFFIQNFPRTSFLPQRNSTQNICINSPVCFMLFKKIIIDPCLLFELWKWILMMFNILCVWINSYWRFSRC